MTDRIKEQLSSLCDGELSEFETVSLLKQLDKMSDEEREEAYSDWQRVCETKSLIQGNAVQRTASSDFLASIRAEIDGDSSANTSESEQFELPQNGSVREAAANDQYMPAAASNSPWSKFAVAASVCLAVVVGVQQYQINQYQGEIVASENTVNHSVSPAINSDAAQYAGFGQKANQAAAPQTQEGLSKEEIDELLKQQSVQQ